MKVYQPRPDDHERSPWRRARVNPTIEALRAQADELQIDAREYAELAQALTDEDAASYRTRAAAAAHKAQAIAAYLEREQRA
jgi:hypothetical protein